MGKYVINNELTPEAILTTDLVNKCTFNVGALVPLNIKDDDDTTKYAAQKRQYYQKFVEVSYPDGDKSGSMIIANCVMHHNIQDYYGKATIYVAIPQSWVREMSLKLSATGNSPVFQDKKIVSDTKYWWTRAAFQEAEEGKE